jgi:hypothetical protein
MVREEWRMHTHLFRGSRFGAFPVMIGLFAAGAVWLLQTTGADQTVVVGGLHALGFLFGLHTGSIGLVSHDTLRNLLGEMTLLVFSARTLPLSRTRLLGVFILKDIVYYMGLFLAPMALGSAIALGLDGSLIGAASSALLLWLTLTLTFVLGLGVTLTVLGLSRRGVGGLVVVAGFAAAGTIAVRAGADPVAYTPYGVYLAQTPLRIAAAVAMILGVFFVGALTFDPDQSSPARAERPAFRRWRRWIGDPLATKTLLDLHRSSGGILKAAFSTAILFGVTAALVEFAGQITGVSPSVGISFGTILGLSGFTTYNWLTQSDSVAEYQIHPVSVASLIDAKFRAFLVVGPAVALGFYVLALIWQGTTIGEAIVGAILLVGVACYIFGTTVYLAGLSPNEFLFDTALFAGFAAAMVVPLVPILVVGFALAPLAGPVLGGVSVAGVVMAALGVALYRRARPRWSARYRAQ